VTASPTALAPAAVGQPSNLGARQNEPAHLERLRAYSYRYRVAQRWRSLRLSGTLVFAAVAPIIAWRADKNVSDALAAIAAGWLVLGRTSLQHLERRAYLRAVRQQELYDVALFALDWNPTVCGPEPVRSDISSDAAHLPMNARRKKRYLDWFSVDLEGVPHPVDVLVCQHQALAWSRKDRQAYAKFLIVSAVLWVVLGWLVAMLLHLTLAEYLIALFLPTAPAVLDTQEMGSSFLKSAGVGEDVERRVEAAVAAGRQDVRLVDLSQCRSFQDAVFNNRAQSPRVPNWFYRLRRRRSDALTRAAAGS
jgi:hypothetical protein